MTGSGTVIAQEFVEPLRDALGSLLTIFAHLDERRPYPRPEESKKNKLWGLELARGVNEAVEIR